MRDGAECRRLLTPLALSEDSKKRSEMNIGDVYKSMEDLDISSLR